MKGLNIYKPRYRIPFQAKTKVFLYKESRLRRFFNIRGWKIVRRGLFKRIVVVLNNMKWTVARRYIRPFAKRRKSARRERQYIRLFQNKQQLRHFYGKFKEESFRNLFRAHLVGVYSRNNSFYSKLESRVDMFLFRSRNFPTLYSANQYVFHQGIEYDGVIYNSPNSVIGPGNSLIFDENLWDIFFENLFDKIDLRYFGKQLLEKRKHYKLRKKIRYFLRRRRRWNKNRTLYIKLIRKIWHLQFYIPKLLKFLSKSFNLNSNINFRNKQNKNKKPLVIKQISIEKSLIQKLKIDLWELKNECLILKNDFLFAMSFNLYGNKTSSNWNKTLKKKEIKNITKLKVKRTIWKYDKLLQKTYSKKSWRYNKFKKKIYRKTLKKVKKNARIFGAIASLKFTNKKKIKKQIYLYLRKTIKLYIKVATFIHLKKKYEISKNIDFIDLNLLILTSNFTTIQEDLKNRKQNIKKIKIKKKNLKNKLQNLKIKVKKILLIQKLKVIKTKNKKNKKLKRWFNIKLKKKITKKKFLIKKHFKEIKKMLKILKKKTKIKIGKQILTKTKSLIKLSQKLIQIKLKKIKIRRKNIIKINDRFKKLVIKKYIKKTKLKKKKTNLELKNKNSKKKYLKLLKQILLIKRIKKKLIKNKILKKKNKKIKKYLLKLKKIKKIKKKFLFKKIINNKNKIKNLKLKCYNKFILNLKFKILKLYLQKLKKNKLNIKNKLIIKLVNLHISNKLNNIKLIKWMKIRNKINKKYKIKIKEKKNYFLKFSKIFILQKQYNILYKLNKRRKLKIQYYRTKNLKKIKTLIALKLQLEKQKELLNKKLTQISEKSTKLINNYIDSLRIKQKYKRWKIRLIEKIELKKDTINNDINTIQEKKKKEYEYKIWKNNIHYNFIKRRRKRRKRRRSSRFRRVHWYIPTYIYFDFESMISLMTHSPKPKEIFYAFKASLTKLHAFYRSRGL